MNFSIKGNLADLHTQTIYPVEIHIIDRNIDHIERLGEREDATLPYLVPGFIDAHVHIESAMLVPSEFARLAVVHGTVATVSDPHEIANVCGLPGVEFMIDNGNTVPFKFFFGAPSCVPATPFETAGAVLDADDVEKLLDRNDILYLSEMMNFPGVLNNDPEIHAKITAALQRNKPVDGHAPGLRGETAATYIAAGISTDHECFTIEEAKDKLDRGMKILIREGSAAKNFDALIPLLDNFPDMIMFCSDDKHPDSLVEGHINLLCKRAAEQGKGLFDILKAACLNPVKHYGLPVGLLRKGDPADFIVLSDLRRFEVLRTYINGDLVAENGVSLINRTPCSPVNNFNCSEKQPADFIVPAGNVAATDCERWVIHAIDGQLITEKSLARLPVHGNEVKCDIQNDILKIAVVNRYAPARVARAFIHNFGLKKGAIASSVAHDSHNIVVVGADDESMARAVNSIIACKGGISCAGEGEPLVLPLPVAGLMSMDDGYAIASAYTMLDKAAKALGSTLSSPFMTLSFMALLVIPHLKLSDKGLFDGDTFSFTEDQLK